MGKISIHPAKPAQHTVSRTMCSSVKSHLPVSAISSGGTKRATSVNTPLLQLQSSEGKSTMPREIEPARKSFCRRRSCTFLRKWRVWSLRAWEKWEVLLGMLLLGTTFWCGLSNHQAATAQMGTCKTYISLRIKQYRRVPTPPSGALPPSLRVDIPEMGGAGPCRCAVRRHRRRPRAAFISEGDGLSSVIFYVVLYVIYHFCQIKHHRWNCNTLTCY